MAQADLQAFGYHGGRLDDARRAYPAAPEPWLDLSTGLNPNPWSPPPDILYDSAPLPTISDLRTLEATAAAYFCVSADRVAAVPGSEIALRLLPALDLPKPLAARRPSYGTHLEVADEAITDGTLPATTGTILVANPNNPDGRMLTPDGLQDLADGWLVVDEAFVDATPDASILGTAAPDAPVVVTRSFGKFFGLAGVRLGFVVAPPAILAGVRRWLGDWPVSAQAIAWGTAAYADSAWIAAARADLQHRAQRLDALLAKHGLSTTGACSLFRLVAHQDAGLLFDQLARAGILTRPFTDRSDWLRFGLPGDEAAFERLDRALANG